MKTWQKVTIGLIVVGVLWYAYTNGLFGGTSASVPMSPSGAPVNPNASDGSGLGSTGAAPSPSTGPFNPGQPGYPIPVGVNGGGAVAAINPVTGKPTDHPAVPFFNPTATLKPGVNPNVTYDPATGIVAQTRNGNTVTGTFIPGSGHGVEQSAAARATAAQYHTAPTTAPNMTTTVHANNSLSAALNLHQAVTSGMVH